jgi:hypothetical protein
VLAIQEQTAKDFIPDHSDLQLAVLLDGGGVVEDLLVCVNLNSSSRISRRSTTLSSLEEEGVPGGNNEVPTWESGEEMLRLVKK